MTQGEVPHDPRVATYSVNKEDVVPAGGVLCQVQLVDVPEGPQHLEHPVGAALGVRHHHYVVTPELKVVVELAQVTVTEMFKLPLICFRSLFDNGNQLERSKFRSTVDDFAILCLSGSSHTKQIYQKDLAFRYMLSIVASSCPCTHTNPHHPPFPPFQPISTLPSSRRKLVFSCSLL